MLLLKRNNNIHTRYLNIKNQIVLYIWYYDGYFSHINYINSHQHGLYLRLENDKILVKDYKFKEKSNGLRIYKNKDIYYNINIKLREKMF